jgi:hypothetical protein
MKKLITAIMVLALTTFGHAQTAVDFTANDCSGTTYNLFTELNSGKVIVLCWVMPCATCVGPALTTYNVVNSYGLSNPNTVYMYLCDDVGNTACSVLNNWGNNNGIYDVPRFSNSVINMMDYGSTGMPKIVVLGGASHTVFYNVNNTVNSNDLQNAINAALTATGINSLSTDLKSLNVYPNPARGNAELKADLTQPGNAFIQLYNLSGKVVQNIFKGELTAGEQRISIDLQGLNAGMYLVKFTLNGKSQYLNIEVVK